MQRIIQEKSLVQEKSTSKSERSQPEFNPDFSQEPSWLKKHSLSSLSSSENSEIVPPRSLDSSENWLVGKDQKEKTGNGGKQDVPLDHSTNSHGLDKQANVFKIPKTPQIPQEWIPEVRSNNPSKILHPSLIIQEPQGEISELPSLYWKPLTNDDNHSQIEITSGGLYNFSSFIYYSFYNDF